MDETDKPAFYWELMKLLLQVAWADDIIEKSERKLVLKLAGRLRLNDVQIQTLEECLDGETPLPPPDLALLRKHREEVLSAAKHVAMADRIMADEEHDMLKGLEAMLGEPGS